MKTSIIFYLILLATSTAFAQSQGAYATEKQGNVWYFGNGAGLDFNSGSPVVLNNNGFANYSQEGSAVACDENGDILLYTDGMSIYNQNHSVMSNGSGLNSHYSTTQSAQIVPIPGSTTLYYVFHLEDRYTLSPSRNAELYYSIVDISANGGLGAVTTKNVLMHGGLTHMEGMDVTYHSNETDIWLITHGVGNNTFYIDLITPSGITSGTQGIGGNTSSYGGLGMFRFAPDGSRLAFINNNQTRAEVYNFDNSTGALSSKKRVSNWSSFTAYGVAFSANGDRLYVSGNNSSGNIYGKLFQYDLTAGSSANIRATELQIATGTSPYTRFSGLRLGPDDKIYLTHFLSSSNALSVVNSPDTYGAGCNYSAYSLPLGTGTGRGLPEYFIPIVPEPLPVTWSGFEIDCETESIHWSTASERNTSHFDVEVSFDGSTFSLLGSVESAGDSDSEINYLLSIKGAAHYSYVQIRQFDLDGATETLGPFSIDCAQSEISIYPNPVHDQLQVVGLENQSSLILIDNSGRIVRQLQTHFTKEISLNTESLAKGSYTLLVKSLTRNEAHRFTKF